MTNLLLQQLFLILVFFFKTNLIRTVGVAKKSRKTYLFTDNFVTFYHSFYIANEKEQTA